MRNDIEELERIEADLLDMILEAGDKKLLQKYAEWLGQRALCNEGLNEYVKEIIKLRNQ